MKIKYSINGKDVSQEEFLAGSKANWLEGPPMAANTYREHDPLISDGLGCMKAQVPEMRDVISRNRVQGVRVRDNGQLEITSRRGRREIMRIRGLCDNDGGYSD